MSSTEAPRREATEDATRWAELRTQMVETQLRSRGIHDPRVLAAMGDVPREEFVCDLLREEAYVDDPLPIGFGQTISQPFTVAYMLQALELVGAENALEIGTGSGYAAAVLSRLVRTVHTVERVPELALAARERLARLGFHNVQVHVGNGTLGQPRYAPFDAVVVTAGANELPSPYRTQLAEGGRLVIPIGGHPTRQALYRFTRHGKDLAAQIFGDFAFVPLVGKYAWRESADA